MARFYGFNRREVDDLTDEEVGMYLEEVPNMRFLGDFAMLRHAFSKYNEEDRRKMLEPASGPDDISSRAWLKFIEPYFAPQEEEKSQPLKISPITAEAIVSWIEKGDLSRSPHGSLVWRLYLFPIWKRLLATLEKAA